MCGQPTLFNSTHNYSIITNDWVELIPTLPHPLRPRTLAPAPWSGLGGAQGCLLTLCQGWASSSLAQLVKKAIKEDVHGHPQIQEIQGGRAMQPQSKIRTLGLRGEQAISLVSRDPQQSFPEQAHAQDGQNLQDYGNLRGNEGSLAVQEPPSEDGEEVS